MIENKRIKRSSGFYALILLFLVRITLFCCLDIKYFYDSYEYISRDGFSWLAGNVDRYRLPVYPMIIDIIQGVFGEHFYFVLCYLQLLVSLVSFVVLYCTLNKLTDRKWISTAVTVLYGVSNAVSGWDKTILTESFSLSVTVFMLWGIISFLKDNKIRYAVIAALLLTLGCFMRAVFVLYAGMFWGALILISIIQTMKKDKSDPSGSRYNNWIGAAISTVPIILVIAYSFAFYNQYGSFTMSDSYLGQQLFVVINNGYYHDSSDAEIASAADGIAYSYEETVARDPSIEERLEAIACRDTGIEYDLSNTANVNLARWYIMDTYDRTRVEAFVEESLGNHKFENWNRMMPNLFETYSSSFYRAVVDTEPAQMMVFLLDDTLSVIRINIFHTLIISLIEIITFVYVLVKKKQIEWIRLGLGAFIMVTIILSIFGTNLEYARTAITAVPIATVAAAGIIDRIVSITDKK